MPKPFEMRFPKDKRAYVWCELIHRIGWNTRGRTRVRMMCEDGHSVDVSLSDARKMHARLGATLAEADKRGLT